MRKLLALGAAAVLVLGLLGCDLLFPKEEEAITDFVTGVTISGDRIVGTGESKQMTVWVGFPVDLSAAVTVSGNPSYTLAWSAGSADLTVDADGLVTGVTPNADGVVVTASAGGKSDIVNIIVEAAPAGLTLGFDTGLLEFQTIASTAAYPQPATVTRSGTTAADYVITMSNISGTFKETDTLQGSSYLLFNSPITGNFEAVAAIKLTGATGQADRFAAGLGMFGVDGQGLVTLDSVAALMSKRNKSSPDVRSQYSKYNESGNIAAGNPSIGITLDELRAYHIFKIKRVGANVTFTANGVEGVVPIIPDGSPAATQGMVAALGGSVKVGLMAAGVVAEIAGFSVTLLDTDGVTVTGTPYTEGDLPSVAFAVNSIAVTGPAGSETEATVVTTEMTKTIQLTPAYVPANASIGNTVTYAVSAGDEAAVTVDANGLVSVSAIGDGEAVITATSGNGKTATYAIHMVDPTAPVTAVAIPATLRIVGGQQSTLTVSSVTPSYVGDKTVAWASSNTSVITVDAVTGVVAVAAGATVGQSATITATSNQTNTVVSNDCVVTVIGGTNYAFPTANWWTGANQAALLASATIPADGSSTNFIALTTATLNSLDGLSYKSNSAGNLRLRAHSVNGNSVNYNGASVANAIPAVGQSLVDVPSRFIQIPIPAGALANVKIDVTIKPITNAAGSLTSQVALVGSDGMILALSPINTISGTTMVLSWDGLKGTLTDTKLIFSRNGATNGGIDVFKITVGEY
jgi:uncharacterized protein YjdB